jgi:hypothetical protein
MPKKTFTPGEILTSADVNDFLMDQTVMTFADGSARSVALPTPTEGMVTYLDSTNKLSLYDGANWVQSDPIEKSLLTTTGDIIYASGAGTPVRLGIGTDTQVLTVSGGLPSWQTAGGGGGGGTFYLATTPGTFSVSLSAGFYEGSSSVNSRIGSIRVAEPIRSTYSGAITQIEIGMPTPTTWTTRTSTFGATDINALTFGNGVYVAAGDAGQLRSSTNAITWTTRTSGFGTTIINALTFGNGVYVAAGRSGTLTTSTDGTTWTTRTSAFGSTEIKALTFGNGVYVAGGNSGTLTTSTDGTTWTTRTSGFGATNINALTFGNGIYVAAGDAGLLRSSTDAITWTARTSGFGTTIIFALTFGNGVYIAGGDNTILTTSTNAITWTTRTSGLSAGADVFSLSYGGLVYNLATNGGEIRTSTDGITWEGTTSGIAVEVPAFAYGNGVFVAAGASGNLTTFGYPTEGGLLAVRPNSPTTAP